jgi:mandelate racemase
MNNPTISSVLARAVNVPLQYPLRTSVGLIATSPLVLIDITTDAGVVGRSYLFTYTPLALEATRQMVVALGRSIEGHALSPFDVEQQFAQRFRLLGRTGIVWMACAGIDMALWDALAIAQGVPLVTLLGGRPRALPAYDSHGMDGKALGIERAARARGEGHKAVKTKVGYPTLEEDLQIVRALRKATGPEMAIMVDFNQGLTVPEATRRTLALQAEGVAWVEEPTLQEDYRGHASIRAKVAVPVQMGENWWGTDEMAKALDAGACDLAMPDAMKIGGVTGWLRAAALAQVRGVPMSSHIFQEVSAHLLAVTPTAHWLERMDLAGPILARPLAFSGGCAVPGDDPGTGILWNEEAVSRYAT